MNFTHIPSNNDLQIFLLAGSTTSMVLVALNKIRFPELNCKMVVDKNPALIVDSTSLHYKINTIFSSSCQNTKSYLMALWESIPIKRFTLTSNLELNWCTTALTLFLMSIDRPLKRKLTTWASVVSLNHAGHLNGYPQPSLSQTRMVAFDKLPAYAHSIKQSFANNTHSPSSKTC